MWIMGARHPGVSPYTPYKAPEGLRVITFCREDLFLGCLSRPSEQARTLLPFFKKLFLTFCQGCDWTVCYFIIWLVAWCVVELYWCNSRDSHITILTYGNSASLLHLLFVVVVFSEAPWCLPLPGCLVIPTEGRTTAKKGLYWFAKKLLALNTLQDEQLHSNPVRTCTMGIQIAGWQRFQHVPDHLSGETTQNKPIMLYWLKNRDKFDMILYRESQLKWIECRVCWHYVTVCCSCCCIDYRPSQRRNSSTSFGILAWERHVVVYLQWKSLWIALDDASLQKMNLCLWGWKWKMRRPDSYRLCIWITHTALNL